MQSCGFEWSSLSISITSEGFVANIQDSSASLTTPISIVFFCCLVSLSFACFESKPLVPSVLCKVLLGLAPTARFAAVWKKEKCPITFLNHQRIRWTKFKRTLTLLVSAVGLFPKSPRAARGLVFLEILAFPASKFSFSWSRRITCMKEEI